jgi:hypothetical protein
MGVHASPIRVNKHVGDGTNSVQDQDARKLSRHPAAVSDRVKLHQAPVAQVLDPRIVLA